MYERKTASDVAKEQEKGKKKERKGSTIWGKKDGTDGSRENCLKTLRK